MRHRRSQRGLVTAELAVAISAAALVMIMLCWGISLLVLELRLVDTASAVARQAARGDGAAMRRAEAAAPPGTIVRVEIEGSRAKVTARLRSDPIGVLAPAVDLGARAVVTIEPGVEE
jgi:hypothetical protein